MSEYKAYTVTDGGDYTTLVFAKSGIAARRIGAGELGLDFEDIESCRRTYWADQYADTMQVPIEAYINNGWWFECYQCCTGVSEEMYNYDKEEPLIPVYEKDVVFCTPECKHHHEEEKRQIKADEDRARAVVEEKFPGCEMLHKDYSKDRVIFTFPGGERSVHWVIGEDTVMVSLCDQEKWKEYRKSVKERGK